MKELYESLIRDADIILSTGYLIAHYVYNLNESKGRKFNLIQNLNDATVFNSLTSEKKYQSPPIVQIVTKDNLKLIASTKDKAPKIIPNGIDANIFLVTQPVRLRSPLNLIMPYDGKDMESSEYCIKAIKKIIGEYPEVMVQLYGEGSKPEFQISSQFIYHKNPQNKADLYNQSAIFILPGSNISQCELTKEAMACGCACIIQNAICHPATIVNNKNAVVIENVGGQDLYESILKLIKDQPLRINLGENASQTAKDFSWEKTVTYLEDEFNSSLTYLERLQTAGPKAYAV